MMSPADARATAPVLRFARFESRGNVEDEFLEPPRELATKPVEARRFDRATCCLRAFSVEK